MDYNMLKTNAINAINALLEAQLITVSRESGIDISILQKYVGDSSAPIIQEKKKRAPPKKKVPVTTTTDVPTTDVPTTDVTTDVAVTEAQVVAPVAEKKKRAPPKKKAIEATTEAVPTITEVTTEVVEVEPVVEKKKRAPPKKKVIEATTEVVPTTEVVEVPTTTEPVVEKKKRAPPKKKTEPVVGIEPVVEEKKKRAPAKKKAEPAEPVNKCYICKNTNELLSTGNSDGYVCENCIANPELGQAFCVSCKRYEETDGDGYCGKCQEMEEAETVKLDDSSDEEEIEYVESSRHAVREVDITGTIYLVDNDDIAFLKSSKKRVGKYNRDKHKIQALNYDSDNDSSSSDDELPIGDDM